MNICYLLIILLGMASMIYSTSDKPLPGVISVQEYLNYRPEIMKTKRAGNVLTLAHLHLSSLNGLQNIPNPETLEVIALYKNDLKNIPKFIFAKFPKLKTLTLNDNAIATIDPGSFEHLKDLRLLQLSGNPLKKFNQQILAGLKELRELHLEDTQLEHLDPFIALPNLELLYLNDNTFKTIDPKVFAQLPKLKWLYLNNNPLTEENKKSLKAALPNVDIKF